jgi:hypothetical protein
MLTGFYGHKGDGTGFFSPEFPRGGLGGHFTLEVLHLLGSPTMTVTVEHKNLDDTSWTSAVVFSAITTTGVKSADATALKEQLRFKFEISATNAWEGVYMLVAAPAWRPY